MRQVACVLDAKAALGECPRWSPAEQALYWVDIARRELHRFDPASGATATRAFDQPVGCFAFRRDGGFVLAMRDGFALLDRWDAEPRPVGPRVLADIPDNRFNDGRCDSRGRFWAGTMDGTRSKSNGALYRLDPDQSVHLMAEGVLTANGLAFSPDDRRMYWSDTPRHVIHVFDFDATHGTIDGRRVFAEFPHGQGRPDGAAVDAEGCYWSGLYDGGRVVRLSPEGQILEEVPIPSRHCTMVALGGPDLRTAYVTTARQGLADPELQDRPQSGGIFSFRVDVPGLPDHDFAG